MTPDTKEATIIYRAGGAFDYLKQNDTAKQLPDKALKAVDSWIEYATVDGGVVRLKAVKDVNGCLGCFFKYDPCEVCTKTRCIEDENIYVEVRLEDRLSRIMDVILHRTGISDLEVLKSEIKAILEE